MASVPSTSARGAVTRCPRPVLQAKGAMEKRSGRRDTKPGALPGHFRWTVNEDGGARLRQVGTVGEGSAGLWGNAQQMFGAFLSSGFYPRSLAPCGSLRLGKARFVFHWSMQRRGVDLSQGQQSLIAVPRMLRGTGTKASIFWGSGAPALWKWPLVWKAGRPAAVILFHFTPSGRRREPEELVADSSREDGSLLEEQVKGFHCYKRLLAGLDRSQQDSPAPTLLWKVLLTGQECTSQEAPSSTYLMASLLKEARVTALIDTRGESSVTTKWTINILKKALLIQEEDARVQPATTTKRTAAILEEALNTGLEDTSHDPPTPTQLAATILKEALLTGQEASRQRALAALLQHNVLEIQTLQECIPERWWDR
ncbi:hypothetical protein NDU88_001054 [Pleurodeles waltl]|uniref:Uncharacterized protein n=1 Tax=Pleurodeles waltl TaxID=8319 RepID=A0AAV7Q2J7_PLEWA|nr:hypothetical protein NDU88_001054 [Pleurodeles waltl]